ncbi:MAG: aconitate hydratase AcnA, partial [Chloroflexi bacterium]
MPNDVFQSRDILKTSHGDYVIYRLDRLERDGLSQLDRLPFSIRIMLEAVLRQLNEREITRQDVINLTEWRPLMETRAVMPYKPARVLMQDFTGVPAVVDLAAMRSVVARMGGNPDLINPLVPVDLVIDHSFTVEYFGTNEALRLNAEIEYQRNRERYEFLHWGQKAFDNFRVVPPATGIVHQVNLEYLAQVVIAKEQDGELQAFPDTLVGTDSHTTMVNALGVVGWGVGGIEAEAAMLGQPIDMLIPEVVGFKMYGELQEGVTATDLTLTVTEKLREHGVVERFVEYYGPGLDYLTLADRATIANMSPEYGATIGFFPVDNETLSYLRLTGRPEELVDRVERYCKEQRLFRTAETPDPEYTVKLDLDLSTVVPSMAGPKRPQDRVPLTDLKRTFRTALTAPTTHRGYALKLADLDNQTHVAVNSPAGNGRREADMKHGSVVIASITSCTNTSNPNVMIGAGMLAKKALERGLSIKPYVKTSMAPGSRVV